MLARPPQPLARRGRRCPRRRPPIAAGPLPLVAATFLLALLSGSCSSPRSPWLVGDQAEKRELGVLFSIIDGGPADPVERFAAIRQAASVLIREKAWGRLASFITAEAEADPKDPYLAWYLFTAGYAYEGQDAGPMAALYYDRIVKTLPDLEVDGTSIHYECLSRLIDRVTDPERRIEYFKDLIARFPDRVDQGTMHFLLGQEYEKVGDWALAVESYAKYLPFFGSPIPGHPDAFAYARNIVDFYNSPKDWAYEDLQELVGKVRSALNAGSAVQLRRLRAKVNFFAVSWHQDETDVNSQAAFDFAEFMTGGRIQSADQLDASSGPRDAYLRTWGWSERISTWYLYFRKIYFPADPEIHGRWEWAGIYFGDKMQ